MGDKIFAYRLVKVRPESLNVVADVAATVSLRQCMSRRVNLLDRHDTNSCQKAHENPKLPELRLVEQRKSSNV